MNDTHNDVRKLVNDRIRHVKHLHILEHEFSDRDMIGRSVSIFKLLNEILGPILGPMNMSLDLTDTHVLKIHIESNHIKQITADLNEIYK